MPKNATSTILVVDDNLGARRSIEALLAQKSYQFLLADNGATALDLLEEHTPDVILLDVMMPGMSGFDVCREIRSNPRVSEIPIIMITALDDEDSMIQGIDAGADDFLSKPISKIELRSRISSILRLNRFRKLCDERQKFELVVTQSNFGYVVLDAEQRIKFFNAAAREILRLDDAPAEGVPFFEQARAHYTLQPDDAEANFLEGQDRSANDPFLLVRSTQRDRDARWIRVSILQLGNRSSEQTLMRMEDITEKIVSFQEKHTFSRMITHKLLTPLNAIKAANQMLVDGQPNPERIQQVADLQGQGISRLEYDIHSILGFLESAKNAHSSTPVSNTLLQIKSLGEALSFPFSIEAAPDPDSSQRIGISAHSFEACLREIVENAIKFKSQEEPMIACSIVENAKLGQIEYRFRNNSQRLTEEELANAWKPYWQADRYFTGEIPGMGLGLSLIATNVWTAGGSCRIENCRDQTGVIVSLTFPVLAS